MNDDSDLKLLDSEADFTKSDGLESWEIVSGKYKIEISASISLNCNVCGERIPNTQDWLLHHFTDWHRRVVKWVDCFRAACIDNQDEDSTTKFDDKINAAKDAVLYTQELFEVDGRLFCCACACEVDDVVQHLGSTKHNELVLSIVDSSAFIKIKQKCLKIDSNNVDEELYRNEILRWLAEELPPTADSPLEVVVLKSDADFYSWFYKYSSAIHNAVKSKELGNKAEQAEADVATSPNSTSAILDEINTLATSFESAASAENEPKTEERLEIDSKNEIDQVAEENCVASEKVSVLESVLELKQTDEMLDENKVESTTLLDRLSANQIFDKSTESPTKSVQSTPTVTLDDNSCKVCDVKFFTRETFFKHSGTDEHTKKMKIYEFLNSVEKFVIGEEPATAQAQFDASSEIIIGANGIFEMYHSSTGLRFWLCSDCYCGSACLTTLFAHIQGVKHKRRYVVNRYPSKVERISNKNEMAAWLHRVVKDVADVEGKGKLKHAMVLADIPEVLKAVGIEAQLAAAAIEMSVPDLSNSTEEKMMAGIEETANLSTDPSPSVSEAKKPIAADDDGLESGSQEPERSVALKVESVQKEKPKEIAIGISNVALQCECCWEVILANKTNKNAKWEKHVASSEHKQKKETRKQWNFDPELFVKMDPSNHVIKALEFASKSSSEVVIVGLDDIVETRATIQSCDLPRMGLMDVVCLTCGMRIINQKALTSHLCSKNHAMKYLNKYYPAKVATVFKGFAATSYSEISRFLKARAIRSGIIRVYSPNATKAKTNGVSTPKKVVSNVPAAKTPIVNKPKINSVKAASASGNVANKKKEPISKIEDHNNSSSSEVQFVLEIKNNEGAKTVPPAAIPKPDTKNNVEKEKEDKKEANSKADSGSTLIETLVTKISDKPAASIGTGKYSGDDISTKLLMDSPTSTIPIRYHAYAQPILDECKEPLIGVEDVCEYCSRDITYEPAYLCKICVARGNAGELISHLTGTEHRLKYFEKKHPSIYVSLTIGTSPSQKSVLQALAIKQHAQLIERTEGRSRISQRLTLLVEPGPYGMRKLSAHAAAQKSVAATFLSFIPTSVPPPFLPPPLGAFAYMTPPPAVLSSSDLLPPGVSFDDNITSSTTLLERVAAPYASKVPPPPGVGSVSDSHKAPLPPGVSANDSRKLSSASPKVKAPGQTHWNASIDRFLAKCTDSPKNSSSGATKEPAKLVNDRKKESKSDAKKESPKKKSESREDNKKEAAKIDERSPTKNSQRRRRSSKSRSRSPKSRSRSRSSRDRHRTRDESKSRRKSPPPSSSKSTRRSRSPSKNRKEVKSKRRSHSPSTSPEPEKKKARVEPKNEKGKKESSSSNVKDLPDLLIKLTEQLVKSGKGGQSTQKTTKPTSSSAQSNFEALLNRVLGEKAKAKPTSIPEEGLGQLLAMLEKKVEIPKAAKISTATSSGGGGDMETLVKLLADEEQRQRRQEEQKNAILALLSSKLSPGSQEAVGVGPGGGPMVIDYAHGSRRLTVQPGVGTSASTTTSSSKSTVTSQLFPNRAPTQQSQSNSKNVNAADDLVNEAMRNVLKAQGNPIPTSLSRPPTTMTTPNQQTAQRNSYFPMDMTRPPPPSRPPGPPQFANFRPPFLQQQQQQQAMAPNSASAIVNAAAAMLLSQLFNQSK